MQSSYALDFFVAHEQDFGQQRSHLYILCSELLEEIDAGQVTAGGFEIFQEAGSEVVRDNIRYLNDRVRAKLPAWWGSVSRHAALSHFATYL